MNQAVRPQPKAPIRIAASACPHDCPSTCALEVEVLDAHTIGRVRGAAANDYTAGVICAKVARYAERIHHPDRLTQPLVRTGEKGLRGTFKPIAWDDALDLVAEKFLQAEQRHGAQAVWPYYYAGTMGLVMRDGIHRLRHAKKYSGFHSTICVNPAYTGFAAGTGRIAGPDPREMAQVRPRGDLGHQSGEHPGQRDDACGARPQRPRRQDRRRRRLHERHDAAGRSRGAGEARHRRRARLRGDALPVPRRQGRLGLSRPLHRCAARIGRACPHARSAMGGGDHRLSGRRRSRSSRGCVGATKRAYFRLGYGFARSRNGAANMHAASCIPAVTGAWLHEGGGAFHNNADIYHWNKSMIEGSDVRDRTVRMLDQSRIGAILTGDRRGACGRSAGDGAADPEHQPGVGVPGPGDGQARLRARRPVHLRARAVHDRDRADGRCRAAGDDVHGARRRLSGRRQPIHPAGPQGWSSRPASAAPTTR